MFRLFLFFLYSLIFYASAFAGNMVEQSVLSSHSTLHSIGLNWQVNGDDNHSAECEVTYRVLGKTQWQPFIPLYRVDYNGKNTLAGSILFLKPGTAYEVHLELNDTDGGSVKQTETISTRSIPIKPKGGRIRHVTPGSGGGTGSISDPLQGISTAQDTARPGDIFILHAGNYGGEIEFNVSGTPEKYIVWQGAFNEEAVIDGIRVNADHVWLENLTVKDRDHGLLTYNSPENVVIKNNHFSNCHYSINLNHGGSNWTITDNVIVGDQEPGSCTGSECYSGEGIELSHTSGHVVAYNTISHVADGISYPDSNCDIYGNEIFDTVDDGIELDYGYDNIRCWENRISNPQNNGISFQPVNGAPWYVLRNQVASPLESAIKFRGADRALIAHNTFVGWSGAVASGSNYLTRVQSNNNLWVSVQDWYAWESTYDDGFVPFWGLNLDYDGFDWGNYSLALKWKGVRYATLEAFNAATGLEEHGIEINRDVCFENFSTTRPPASMSFEYFTLTKNCNANDSGVILPGINDDYTGSAPDLGAYESGKMLPHYGVRMIDHDNDGDVDGLNLMQITTHSVGLKELSMELAHQFGSAPLM